MPQLLQAKDRGRMHIGPGVLTSFPVLSAHIGQIAAHEAQIQVYSALVLGAMLGPSRTAGLTMYNALSGATQKRATLTAVAEVVLDKGDLREFQKIEKKQASSRGMRNAVVHGIWAGTDKHPDRLLRIDPKEQLSNYAKFGTHPMRDGADRNLRLWIWTEKDFETVERAVAEVAKSLVRFMGQIENKYPQTVDAALKAAIALAGHRET